MHIYELHADVSFPLIDDICPSLTLKLAFVDACTVHCSIQVALASVLLAFLTGCTPYSTECKLARDMCNKNCHSARQDVDNAHLPFIYVWPRLQVGYTSVAYLRILHANPELITLARSEYRVPYITKCRSLYKKCVAQNNSIIPSLLTVSKQSHWNISIC